MRALSCPKCGAPMQSRSGVCCYCGVYLLDDDTPSHAKSAPAQDTPQTPVVVPAGWVSYKDPWVGFSLAHPAGWQVMTSKGLISIRQDIAGLTSALIWAFPLNFPLSARDMAQQFTAIIRQTNPTLQVWIQGNAAADSKRVSIRTQKMRWGHNVEGYFNVLCEGLNVIISGYEAPAQTVAQYSETMTQILSTFRTHPPMSREFRQEPSEGAFTIQIPTGWVFQGGVNRNNIGGSGLAQFSIGSDASGRVMAAMPWFKWMYMASRGFSFFNPIGGPQTLPFMSAEQYCTQNIIPWMRQFQSGLRVEAIQNRPDLADQSQLELAQAGYAPGSFDTSMATLETTYDENGLRFRQLSRVGTIRERNNMGMFNTAAPLWQGLLDVYYRSPDSEFSHWQPVLNGILDSLVMNPAWKAGERQLANNFIANAQADINRRTRQISQTLAETSDIITSGYWNRHANDARYSEMRQNATMGVQNVASSSGEEYKVPLGYDRYWSDGLGNLYGGSWMSQPDVTWTPLEPTGI